MNIIESLEWRYACKKFDNTKFLTNKQLEILKNAFNLTATSFGLQPLKLLIIQNKKIQESLVKYTYGQEQVANASHLFVLCIQDNFSLNDIENYFDLEKKVRGTS